MESGGWRVVVGGGAEEWGRCTWMRKVLSSTEWLKQNLRLGEPSPLGDPPMA